MKKLVFVSAFLGLLLATPSSEAGPFLRRFMFQSNGPIQIPIPAFNPFFPGGNIVINPGAGGGSNTAGSTGVDAETFNNISKNKDRSSKALDNLQKAFPADKKVDEPIGGKKG